MHAITVIMRITMAVIDVAIRARITIAAVVAGACDNGVRKGIHNFRENFIHEEFELINHQGLIR